MRDVLYYIMNNCTFCKTQTEKDICPKCCAIMPNFNCKSSGRHSVQNNTCNNIKILNCITSITTISILIFYPGPAWIMGVLLGSLGATNLNIQDNPISYNKRSFYFVEKLFQTVKLQEIFISPDDFVLFKIAIQKMSKKITDHQRYNIDFSEIFDKNYNELNIKSKLNISNITKHWPAFFELLKAQCKRGTA